MKRICVFCGSNRGSHPDYTEAARQLGQLLAARGIRLVYGGGKVGLMGEIADAVLESGGEVTGVIPGFLQAKEVGHDDLTEMIVVETMHTRKAIMAEQADGFIAMPGGFGTMDELCEILTWAQLGLHQRPIGLLNVRGYFQTLNTLFDHMVAERFLHQKNREMLLSHHDPERLLDMMAQYRPPDVAKWLDNSKI
ncbi:MAG: TIGR00730 family Rossman fold protein [Bacteroidetes bacterium]|nr:MAG: TIGR00730 family Rossman fold protein [Bacteroidota bacterium]